MTDEKKTRDEEHWPPNFVPVCRLLPDGRRLRLGVESPGFVRLYAEDPVVPSCSPVTHEEWFEIVDGLGASPGEMLLVSVYREVEDPRRGRDPLYRGENE